MFDLGEISIRVRGLRNPLPFLAEEWVEEAYRQPLTVPYFWAEPVQGVWEVRIPFTQGNIELARGYIGAGEVQCHLKMPKDPFKAETVPPVVEAPKPRTEAKPVWEDKPPMEEFVAVMGKKKKKRA